MVDDWWYWRNHQLSVAVAEWPLNIFTMWNGETEVYERLWLCHSDFGLSFSPLIAFWGMTLEETTANHPRVSTVDMKETDGYSRRLRSWVWCSNRWRLHPPGKIRGSYLDLSTKNHQKFTASKLASDSTKPLWFDATKLLGITCASLLSPRIKSYETQAWAVFNVGSPWRFQSNLSQESRCRGDAEFWQMVKTVTPWTAALDTQPDVPCFSAPLTSAKSKVRGQKSWFTADLTMAVGPKNDFWSLHWNPVMGPFGLDLVPDSSASHY